MIRAYDYGRLTPQPSSPWSELWLLLACCISFIIEVTLLSSMDSDLEAFSHNPTDGSFTALAVQLTVFTNYPIQGFLSY